MRIRLIKHNCNAMNLVQLSNNIEPKCCPMFHRMWNAYAINFLGYRLIIGDYK